uniref:RNA-directed DNA polymerase n=1 Tax=Trichuris muris TaxID=70415 RepID=A0A5S6QPX8_TRIMR
MSSRGAKGAATNGDRGRIVPEATQFPLPLPVLAADTSNAAQWFERLEAFFEVHGTAEDRKAGVLRFYLADNLRQLLPGLGVEAGDSYDRIRQTLLRYLRDDTSGIVARTSFFSRKQLENERLQAFMANLRVLCGQAFPDLKKPEQASLLVDQFTRGVRSDAVRAALVRARCASPETALDLAVTEERDVALISCLSSSAGAAAAAVNIMDSQSNEDVDAVPVSPVAVQLDTIQQLTEAVQRLLTQTTGCCNATRERRLEARRQTRWSGATRCFNCGGRGHTARVCPSPARRMRQNEHDAATRRGETSRLVNESHTEVTMTVALIESCSAVKALGCVSGCPTELTIDTGAAVSLMDYKLFATGSEMKIAGTSTVDVSIGGAPARKHTVLVAHGLTCPCLIGADFLRRHKCVIDFTTGILQIGNYDVELKSESENDHTIALVGSAQTEPGKYDEVIDAMCSKSTAPQDVLELLRKTLLKYCDVISMADDDLGCTSVVRHEIRTGDAKPIKIGPRRTPYRHRSTMETLVDRMLRQGVIERASGPWSFPVVLASKKDGSSRFCVDYRKLNDVTEKNAQPLPRIDDALDALAGSRWFSTLDLASGYWQVEVEARDRPKTAFTTPSGLYQFRVMPFGLCNAPATFQRLMEKVLEGLQWRTCLVYLDDIIVFARTPTEQMQRLDEVLNRLQKAGLKLKPSKCKLMTTEVVFLGHTISDNGIATDASKCAAVERWQSPRCLNELRQFLAPLHRLLRKDTKWVWNQDCEQAFQQLKHNLLSAPVLRLPDFTKTFILDVDASGDGLGAVLSQCFADGEHPIAYASRTLSKPERRYCATRRELLALPEQTTIVWYGSTAFVSPKVKPLAGLNAWLNSIWKFATALDDCTTTPTPCPDRCALNVTDMRSAQDTDDEIRVLKEWIRNDNWPGRCPEGASRNLRILWGQKDALLLEDGILLRRWDDCSRQQPRRLIVVPSRMQAQVLSGLHDGVSGGHFGKQRTLAKARSRFYWPGMAKDVELWCKSCDVCARRKGHRRNRLPLQPLPVGYPFQRVGIDFLGPLPTTTNGKRKHGSSNGSETAHRQLHYPFRPPRIDVKKTRTTPYHAQSNGLVERFNRTLLDTLAALAKDFPHRWDDMLPWATFAYNTSNHETTGISPFLALFGREARLPIDLQYDLPATDNAESLTTYVQELRKNLENVHAAVRQHLHAKQQGQKNYYDRRRYGNPFQNGDRVWLAVPQKGKISARWDGPFVIKKKITDHVYRLDRRPRRDIVVHGDRLKRYDDRPQRLQPEPAAAGPYSTPPTPQRDQPTAPQPVSIPPRPRPTCSPPVEPPRPKTPTAPVPVTAPPSTPPQTCPTRDHRRPSRFRDYVLYALSFGRAGLDRRGSSVTGSDSQVAEGYSS